MNLFIVKIDYGNGWVNMYQPSNIEKLKSHIKLRGVEKVILRLENEEKYQEYTSQQIMIM